MPRGGRGELRDAIEARLMVWETTAAERDLAQGILKRFSHRELARPRDMSAATSRRLARGVHGKTKLPDRTAFAAFCLGGVAPSRGDHALR